MSERDEIWWTRVKERDAAAAGTFVYGVATTGVYCAPGCRSRLPRRENVHFFASPDLAEGAGYRPCKRCSPRTPLPQQADVQAVVRACRRLAEGASVAQVVAESGWSARHLRRIFIRHCGVGMGEYARACRADAVRRELADAESVTEGARAAGEAPGRALYEDVARRLGMTPGGYRAGGAGETVVWSVGPSALGEVLVAATLRGVCAVRLGAATELATELAAEFPKADLLRDDVALASALDVVADLAAGRPARRDLPLDLRGTTFQMEVWKALREIPVGETRTYAGLAREVGRPRAHRAAASACGANPVALVVPCHRIIRSDGSLGGYRWGIDRKRELLMTEGRTPPETEN